MILFSFVFLIQIKFLDHELKKKKKKIKKKKNHWLTKLHLKKMQGVSN